MERAHHCTPLAVMSGRNGFYAPLMPNRSGSCEGPDEFFKNSLPAVPFILEIKTAVVPHQVKMTSVSLATLPKSKHVSHASAWVPLEVIEIAPVHTNEGMYHEWGCPVSAQVVPGVRPAGPGTESWQFRIAHAVVRCNARFQQAAVAFGNA